MGLLESKLSPLAPSVYGDLYSQGYLCQAEWICPKLSFSNRNHICTISMSPFLKGTYHKESSSLILLLSLCHPTVSCLKVEKNGAPWQPPPCLLHHPSSNIHQLPPGHTHCTNLLAQMAFQTALNVLSVTVVKTPFSDSGGFPKSCPLL